MPPTHDLDLPANATEAEAFLLLSLAAMRSSLIQTRPFAGTLAVVVDRLSDVRAEAEALIAARVVFGPPPDRIVERLSLWHPDDVVCAGPPPEGVVEHADFTRREG